MGNNAYQDFVTQAWTTYTETQAKYRGGDYATLLKPLYQELVTQLGGIDDVVTALGKTTPPSDTALTAAQKQFSLVQGTLDSIGNVLNQFPDMDKKAINRAATLDQGALRKVYAGVQDADEGLFTAFSTTTFNAQEAAARAVGVYAPDPQLATSTKAGKVK
ncbi:MAG: hypothetical protein JKY27_07300 [Magnetovibrio sp.]|nr:hypothetical protein [Magnetovibrio sp.]